MWGGRHKHSVHGSNKSTSLSTMDVFVPLTTTSPDLSERKALTGMERLPGKLIDPNPELSNNFNGHILVHLHSSYHSLKMTLGDVPFHLLNVIFSAPVMSPVIGNS